MRIRLQLHSIPIIGALLPALDGEEPMAGFPMILPMGWIDSPQFLCSVTETIADLANSKLASPHHWSKQPHRLDGLADSCPQDLPLLLGLIASPLHHLRSSKAAGPCSSPWMR